MAQFTVSGEGVTLMVAVGLRRTAAIVAALAGVLHLLMLGHGGLVMSLLMVAMAMICLPCAGHLWRGDSPRAWTMIALMNAGMVVLHLGLMRSHGAELGDSAEPVPHAHHHGEGLGPAGLHEPLMHLALGFATAEILLVLVAVCWYLRGRHRAVRLTVHHVAEERSPHRRLQEESTASLQLSRTVK
ncbi:hypothetical protein [Nesterenkonia suensis]